MIIYTITTDDDCGTSSQVFTDEAKADAYYAETVKAYWDEWMGNEKMPDDPEDAWDRIVEESGCIDSLIYDAVEIKLPPVYEAAPELLKFVKTLHLASTTKNCGVTNGEAVLCSAYESQAEWLIAKAEGRE